MSTVSEAPVDERTSLAQLTTVQASANRDEELVERGDRFDLFREPVRHQAFGNGPHFCLGTHVARKLVGEIALPRLFERFPDMRSPIGTPSSGAVSAFAGL